MDLRLFWSHCF